MFDEKQHCLCHLGSMLAYLYFQILIFDLGVQRLVWSQHNFQAFSPVAMAWFSFWFFFRDPPPWWMRAVNRFPESLVFHLKQPWCIYIYIQWCDHANNYMLIWIKTVTLFISLRLMPPAFAGLEIASSMARSTTKSSSNNSTILSIASSMARRTTKSNSNSSNNQQQQ